ncbi:hypothetical protein MD484_g543, partial [Candolleomyces efflorescens]
MTLLSRFIVAAFALAATVHGAPQDLGQPGQPSGDPCARIGVRVNETVKANILEVIGKTLNFHTSTNYQIRAPQPFSSDVRVNLPNELERIRRQSYRSEYDLHVDLSRTLKRANDGHAAWTFACYDSLFVNYVPTPLSLLTSEDGTQNVHISPEAFNVSSAEFPDQIDLSGSRVLLINGRDPFDAVNANTLITGSYQAFGTRQNTFFSSYQRGNESWNYIMGNFAQQALPLSDTVRLTILRSNRTRPETFVLPYRSRFGSQAKPFTDTASWRANNCVAQPGTNGVDRNSNDPASRMAAVEDPMARYQQQPALPSQLAGKYPLDVLIDSSPLSNVLLPEELKPSLSPVNGSRSVSQFYLLKDGTTGVLALGSFSDTDYSELHRGLLVGLLNLKSLGATRLVVDVSNNGGGYICAAHWLHRIIAGPKSTTEPQAGLDTKARAGTLARSIVDELVKNPQLDPDLFLNYNPVNWRDANNVPFNASTNWLQPVVNVTINGRPDAFSPRLGQECQPEGFPYAPPTQALFDPRQVVIVSNGRCASSCSLFSISMAKYEGSKTVVLGGKHDVAQQYCGTVGGQSTNFRGIDTEIKTTRLKGHPLAPPDLLVNGGQEWQDHPADLNLPITEKLANNPVAIWEEVAARLLS